MTYTMTLTDLDLLGRALELEPDQTVRHPAQGDIWGDDRAPKPRRNHPGQTVIPECEPATVTRRRPTDEMAD